MRINEDWVEFWGRENPIPLEWNWIDRLNILRYFVGVVASGTKPRVLEIGIDRGEVFGAIKDLLVEHGGTYTGVDITLDKMVGHNYSWDTQVGALRDDPGIPECNMMVGTFLEMDSTCFWFDHDIPYTWDLVWVDGCHGRGCALMDVVNSLHRLSNRGVLLIDDVIDSESAVDGPSYAYRTVCERGGSDVFTRMVPNHPHIAMTFRTTNEVI